MASERTSARNAPRLEIALQASLISSDPSRAPVPVTTRDLGPGGALCESGTTLLEGEEVSFRLDLPAGASGGLETLALPARIIRVEGANPYVIAVQFNRAPARIVELLKRYLWRLSRETGR
ncbi:MAG TPA: PilZ domain-containing protein [Patescibacteria group bacterium]|nr:PilZ domain-containing protein [Patescibacteria group bacterium]